MAEEEKSLGEWFKELGEFLEDAAWLESIAPIVDLLSPESINGFFKTDFNKSGTWGEIFTGFDTGFSLLQAAGGFGKILQGAFNKDLTDREGDMLIAAGITDMGAGISGALEALLKSTKKYPNAVQGLNTAGSLFGGLAGVFDSYRAIKELANADTAEKRAGAGCELAAGILDTAAAYCELSGHKEFAVPIKVLAASFKIAARFFQEGKWGLGILTIAIGAAIAGALYVGFEAVKNAIIAALNSLLAPLSINPVTVAAAIAIAATLLAVTIQLIKTRPFAQGGFPEQGQMFIAREAGPELVGTLNGRTAVVNNDQIVASVSRGVHDAFRAALNGDSESPAIARVYLDGKLVCVAGQA